MHENKENAMERKKNAQEDQEFFYADGEVSEDTFGPEMARPSFMQRVEKPATRKGHHPSLDELDQGLRKSKY